MQIDPSVIHVSALGRERFYPYAAWRPLPENAIQPHIQPTQFIMHTMAAGSRATLQSSWNYAAQGSIVTEPHFLLDMDGAMWQIMDYFVRADNNTRANVRAISIETVDNGGATVNTTPWTPEQVEQLAGLLAWLHLHPLIGVPLVRCPAWDAPGYAPHNAFAEWSSAAHSCPGAARTAQVPEVAQRAQAIVDWQSGPIETPPPAPAPTPGDSDMSTRILRSMSNPPEYAAQFIAVVDNHGVAIELQWTGSGDDPRVVERLGALRNAGVTDMPAALSDIRHCALHPKNTPEQIAAADGIYPHWSYDNFAP